MAPNFELGEYAAHFREVARDARKYISVVSDLQTLEGCVRVWDGLAGAGAALSPWISRSDDLATACSDVLEIIRLSLARGAFGRNLGLLGGRAGVLLCACEIAAQLGRSNDTCWIYDETKLLCAAMRPVRLSQGDFANGLSGAICGLIWLRKTTGIACEDVASAATEALLAQIHRLPIGVALRYDPADSFGPKCGLAHGASGAAVAFLEAADFFGCNELNILARAALTYEEGMFHEKRMWPDLRRSVARTSTIGLPSAGYSWCYGSSGNGLVFRLFSARRRLSAYHRRASEIVVHTIDYASKPAPTIQNYSVCHGLGSFLGLVFSDKHSGRGHHNSRFVRDAIERCTTALHTACVGDFSAVESHFHSRVDFLPPELDPIRQHSYFLGLSGVASVLQRIISSTPPNHLLLPFPV